MKKIILGVLLVFSVSLAGNVDPLTIEEEAFIFQKAIDNTKEFIGNTRTTVAVYIFIDTAMNMSKNKMTKANQCIMEFQVSEKLALCDIESYNKFTNSIKHYSKQQREDVILFMMNFNDILIEMARNGKKKRI